MPGHGDPDHAMELFPSQLRQGRYAPLRLRALYIDGVPEHDDPAAILRSTAVHTSVTQLTLHFYPLDRVGCLEALAGLPFKLTALELLHCQLSPASLPGLTTLIERQGGTLSKLRIYNGGEPLLRGPAVASFCASLREASSLKKLHLGLMQLWDEPQDGLQIIQVCMGHRALRTANFKPAQSWQNDVPPPPSIQAALKSLAASNGELEVITGP